MTSGRRTTFQLSNDEQEFDDSALRHDNQMIQEVERAARRLVGGRRRSRYSISRGNPVLGVEGESIYQTSPQMEQPGIVSIHRPVYSQSDFQKCFEENTQDNNLHKRFLDSIFVPKVPALKCKQLLLDFFPIVNVLRHYKWKRDIGLDIVSGITTAVMRIPQSMAYAFLAKLPPTLGLYTAFFSALFYVIFGGSNHMVTGAQGVLSLMLGSGIDRYLHTNFGFNHSTINGGGTLYERAAVQVAIPITMMAGVIQMTLGIFKLGFITNYLSDPLVGGFTTGAACQVVISLLKDVCGHSDINATGWFKSPLTIYNFFKNIQNINLATMTISLFSIIFLSLFKFINKKCRLKLPLPGELFVMTVVILFSYLTDAANRWNVEVVGPFQPGFQPPELPSPKIIPQILDVSFTSAIVSFAIGYSISKRLALKHDYEVNGNQEVFAFGFMNCAQSFFHGFVATASMSVSELHDSLGGVSQLANVVASLIVLKVILFLGFLFQAAPDCLLSAIILVNLKNILLQFGDLKALWRVSKIDFLLWMTTWIAVFILDVDIGLLIGVTFSLLTVVFRTQWPYVCELGRIPSTDLYKNRVITPEAVTLEGIRIFRFEGSLYFASADHFRKSLYKQSNCNPYKIIRGRLKFFNKIEKLRDTLRVIEADYHDQKFVVMDETTPLIQTSSPQTHVSTRNEVHHIIFDFSTCSFIDSVGVRTLNQCIADYKEAGIAVYLANVRAAVRSVLFNDSLRSGVSPRKTFLSVHDAVLTALMVAQRQEERDYILMDAVNSSYYRHNVSRMSMNDSCPQRTLPEEL